jgi:hypothetical protein
VGATHTSRAEGDDMFGRSSITVSAFQHPYYGEIVDVRLRDGHGVRFTAGGEFMGFVDPRR